MCGAGNASIDGRVGGRGMAVRGCEVLSRWLTSPRPAAARLVGARTGWWHAAGSLRGLSGASHTSLWLVAWGHDRGCDSSVADSCSTSCRPVAPVEAPTLSEPAPAPTLSRRTRSGAPAPSAPAPAPGRSVFDLSVSVRPGTSEVAGGRGKTKTKNSGGGRGPGLQTWKSTPPCPWSGSG